MVQPPVEGQNNEAGTNQNRRRGTDWRRAACQRLSTAGRRAGRPGPGKNAKSRCFDLNKNGKVDGAEECEGDLEFKLALPASIPNREQIPFNPYFGGSVRR